MKTPSIDPLAKTSDPIFTSIPKCPELPGFEKEAGSCGPAQSINLLLTTIHPESADAGAGEVVYVPVEFVKGAVLLDLKEVTQIDSRGLALLLEAMQRITARGGSLILTGIDERIRGVLETAKLDRVFQIAPTREHALAEHCQLLAA